MKISITRQIFFAFQIRNIGLLRSSSAGCRQLLCLKAKINRPSSRNLSIVIREIFYYWLFDEKLTVM